MKSKINISLYGLMVFLAIVIYSLVGCSKKPDNTNMIEKKVETVSTINIDTLEQILSHQFKSIKLSNKSIYLFINRESFLCHSCYEQFLKIVEKINSKYKRKGNNILLVFPENKEEGNFQKIKTKKWLEAHDLHYENIIIKNESIDFSLKRSCVILKKEKIILMNIPMTFPDLDKLQNML